MLAWYPKGFLCFSLPIPWWRCVWRCGRWVLLLPKIRRSHILNQLFYKWLLDYFSSVYNVWYCLDWKIAFLAFNFLGVSLCLPPKLCSLLENVEPFLFLHFFPCIINFGFFFFFFCLFYAHFLKFIFSQKNNIWNRILAHKAVVLEPRGKDAFTEVIVL